MKVFASKYLESTTTEKVIPSENWNWQPQNADAYRLYASGNSTRSQESTYAAEKDHRADEDRPNEGMSVA